jgi:hypothetical protein
MYMHSLETEHWSWITDHEQMLSDHESQDFDVETMIFTLDLETTNENGEYYND